MSHITGTPTTMDESWKFKEVREKVLMELGIFKSADYARTLMGGIRKKENLRRITAIAFANFYKIDIYLFYGLNQKAEDGWKYKEINEKILTSLHIYKSTDYARTQMGYIRKMTDLKRLSAFTFAKFYGIDMLMFYGLK